MNLHDVPARPTNESVLLLRYLEARYQTWVWRVTPEGDFQYGNQTGTQAARRWQTLRFDEGVNTYISRARHFAETGRIT